MFDLFRSRAKAMRYLLGALLLMVAISMVVTLIPGYGSGGQRSQTVVAEVGDDVLTLRQVQTSIQSQMKNKGFPPEMAQHYVPIIIQQMIADLAVSYQAQRMGFEATDEDVARTIQSMLPQLFQDGKFAGQEAYSQMLAQQNTNIPEFEALVHKQMVLIKLQNIILEGVVVSPQEIEQEYRRRSEKIKLEYVVFNIDPTEAQKLLTREEMLAYYNERKTTYFTQEKRGFHIVVADQRRMMEAISIPDEEIRRLYDNSKDRFRTPERARVRHILLKTTEKPKEELEKIRAKVEGLLKQLKGGADFAEVAKKNSEDPGSATKGGDLDWITRGQTVKNFEEAAFTLKPKELSKVIQTEYGFHLLQVYEKETARLRPFEEVKAELAAERKGARVVDSMQAAADAARAELVKDPAGAEKIAKKHGLHFVAVEKAAAGDPIPEIGVNPEFERAIQAPPKDGVTAVVQIGADKLVSAVVREIFPRQPAGFAEVENSIRSQMGNQKAMLLYQQRGEAFGKKLKELGNDFDKTVKALNAKVLTSPEIDRQGTIERVGSGMQFEEAFSKPVGAVGGPLHIANAIAFYRVAAKVAPDAAKMAEQREEILIQIKARKARERKDLFEDGLITQLIKEKKIKMYDDVIKRLVASYRS